MPDHDAPDPVDKAYVEAETLLDDEVARRARRARVLEAVAREPALKTISASQPRKHSGWRYVGWLTAASVAGLGGLIVYQLSPTASLPTVTGPASVTPEPAPPSAMNPSSMLDAEEPAAVSPPLRRAPQPEERAPEAAQSAAAQMSPPAPVAPPPVAAPEAAAAPSPPSAFPASQGRAEGVEARTAPPPVAPVAPQAPAARLQSVPTADLGARLRAAAAAGRIAEVSDLLAQGAPVDARDSDGETALMKSVRANQPQTAALLRRRGADPDLENRAGLSAREMAEAADNPALERALTSDR